MLSGTQALHAQLLRCRVSECVSVMDGRAAVQCCGVQPVTAVSSLGASATSGHEVVTGRAEGLGGWCASVASCCTVTVPKLLCARHGEHASLCGKDLSAS
jgi:hypothetical protein